MTDEEISKVKDLLLEQRQAVRPRGVFVTEENLVAHGPSRLAGPGGGLP
jgi:hypothetical protein